MEVKIGFVISYDGGDDGDCGYGYVCFFYGDGVCIDVCYGDDGVYGDVGCGCWDIFFWGNCDGDLDDVYDFFEWCGLIWIKMK